MNQNNKPNSFSNKFVEGKVIIDGKIFYLDNKGNILEFDKSGYITNISKSTTDEVISIAKNFTFEGFLYLLIFLIAVWWFGFETRGVRY